MKIYAIPFLAALLLITACATTKLPAADKNTTAVKDADTIRIANEELEYEIIIIDPGFTGWLSRAQPRGYYKQPYLETKNQMWVNEWNIRFSQPQRYNGLYEMKIDYSPTINYGYEVNYLLYNYLVYFQNKTGQRLGGNVPAY